ncbi:MAG: RcpC/CpaB family pilus assembly protein [Actinomycetes bacterium]
MTSSRKSLLAALVVALVAAWIVFRVASAPSSVTSVPTVNPTGTASAPAEVLPAVGPLSVPSGMFAVSVDLADAAHVGRFLRPGSHIMILDTVAMPATSTDPSPQKITRILLSNVLVLAIANHTTSDQVDSTLTDASNFLVTVAVTQKQAEKLVHGIQTGALYMALLNGTTQVIPDGGVNDANIFDGVN